MEKGTSSGGFLATTLINSLSEYVSMDGRTINKQLRSLIDPIYPENSYKEVITGSIVHLYAEHPLEEDFYLYDYFSDSQDISVVVFDEIDYEYIFPAINTSERYVASVVINKHPDLGIRGFVYLKSQFGDYVVPINLTDNASSNLVASVEKIDFGVVFAGLFSNKISHQCRYCNNLADFVFLLQMRRMNHIQLNCTIRLRQRLEFATYQCSPTNRLYPSENEESHR